MSAFPRCLWHKPDASAALHRASASDDDAWLLADVPPGAAPVTPAIATLAAPAPTPAKLEVRGGDLAESVQGDFLHCVIHKRNGSLQPWVNGVQTSELPSPAALHVVREGSRTLPSKSGGLAPLNNVTLTPVCVSMLVERGERPPDRVVVQAIQTMRVNGDVVQCNLVSEIDLAPTREGECHAASVQLPYPAAYCQRPYVEIDDVESQVNYRERIKKKNRLGVAKGAISAMVAFIATLGAMPDRFTVPLSWFPWIGAIANAFRNNAVKSPDGTYPSLWTDNVPTVAAGIAATFNTLFGAMGTLAVATSMAALGEKARNLVLGERRRDLERSTSNTREQIESQMASKSSTLSPDKAWSELYKRDDKGEYVMPQDLRNQFMAEGVYPQLESLLTNYYTARPLPQPKQVRFTLPELSDAIAQFVRGHRDAKPTQQEQVLYRWMLVPGFTVEGSLGRWVPSRLTNLLGISPLDPRSGPMRFSGFSPATLKQHTVQLHYRVCVYDVDAPEPTAFEFTAPDDLHSGLQAMGYAQDLEVLDRRLQECSKRIDAHEEWSALSVARSMPLTALGWVAKSVPGVRSFGTRGSRATQHALDRLHREVLTATAPPRALEQAILDREREQAPTNRNDEWVRAFPTHMKVARASVTVRWHDADTSTLAESVEALEAGQGTALINSKSELSKAVRAATDAHTLSGMALRMLLPVWQNSTRKLHIVQRWNLALAGQGGEQWPRRHGVSLGVAHRKLETTYAPFAAAVPRDVVYKGIVSQRTRTDREQIELVARRDGAPLSVATALAPEPGGSSTAKLRALLDSGRKALEESPASVAAMHAFLDVEIDVRRRVDFSGIARVLHSGPQRVKRRVERAARLCSALTAGDAERVLRPTDLAFVCLEGGDDAFRLLSRLQRLYHHDGEPDDDDSARFAVLGTRIVTNEPELMRVRAFLQELREHTDEGILALRSLLSSMLPLYEHSWTGVPWTTLPSLARYTLEMNNVGDALASIAPVARLARAALPSRSKEAFSVFVRAVRCHPTLHAYVAHAAQDENVPPLERVPRGREREWVDSGTPARADVLRAMRVRAARHQIPTRLELDSNANDRADDPVGAVCAALERQRIRAEPTELFLPFAAGDWQRLVQFPLEAGLLFDLVPVSLQMLDQGLARLTGADSPLVADEVPVAFVRDRAASRDPYIVALESGGEAVATVVFSHVTVAHTGTEPREAPAGALPLPPAAWKVAGDEGPGVHLDAHRCASMGVVAIQAARDAAASLLWNAERIAQATYALLGTEAYAHELKETVDPDAPPGPLLRVEVALPQPWRRNPVDDARLETAVDDAKRKLDDYERDDVPRAVQGATEDVNSVIDRVVSGLGGEDEEVESGMATWPS